MNDPQPSREPLSSEEIHRMLSRITDGIVALDAQWRYTYVNQKAAMMLNRQRPEDLVGKHIWTEYPEGVGLPFYHNYHKAMETQQSIVMEDYYEPWDRWFENRIYPSPDGLSIFFTEITERKRAEDALHESEERLRLSTELANVAVWEYSFITNSMSRSKNHDKLYGLDWQTKWEFETFVNATHPDDREHSNAIIQKSVAAGGPDNYKFDFRVVYPNQSIRWLEVTGQVVERNLDGQGTIVRGCLIDITERKQAEEALRESEERYRLISSVASDYVFSSKLNEDGKFELNWVAGAFERITGYTLDEYVAIGGWRATLHPDDAEIDNRDMEKLRNNQRVVTELRTYGRNGNIVWVRVHAHPIWDTENQKLVGIYGAGEDITERKRAEEKLRESERKLSTLVGNLPGMAYRCLLDRDWTMKYVSNGCVQLTGYEPDDFIDNKKLTFDDIIREDYRDLLWNKWEDVLKSGKVFRDEYPITTADGNQKWVWEQGCGIYSDTGEVIALEGFITDITESKQADEMLRESEEKFATIFKAAPGSMILSSLPDGKTIEVNDNFSLITGYSREEAIGKTTGDLNMWAEPDARDRFLSLLQQNGIVRDFEADLNHKSGAIRNGLASGHIITVRGKKYLIGTFYDITERKRAEESLQVSETKFRQFAENIREVFWMTDPTKNQMLYVSPSYEEIWGRTCESLYTEPRNWIDAIHIEDRDRVVKSATTKQGLGEYDEEYRIMRPDGTIRWIHDRAFPVKDEKDIVYRIAGVADDITERKLANEGLRENEQRLTSIYDTVGDVIFHIAVETEGQYRFISVNSSFSRVTGLTREQIIGKTVSEIIPEPSLSLVLGKYRQAIESKTIVRWEETSNYPAGTVTGEVSIAPVFDTEGRCTHLVGSVHDTTERKRAEEALAESEARWQSYVSNAPNVIFTVDKDYKITFMNYTLPGYSLSDAIGVSIFNFLPEESKQVARKTLDKVFETGERQSYEVLGYGMHGEPAWYSTNVGPIKKGGKVLSLILVATDITARKRAEEELKLSEEKYRGLVDTMQEGLGIQDKNGLITFMNKRACEMLGYELEELIGKSGTFVFDEENQRILREQMSLRRKGEHQSYEIAWLRKDGGKIDTIIAPSPRFDEKGNFVESVAVFTDITERKRAEAALRETHDRMVKIVATTPGIVCSFRLRPDGSSCFLYGGDRIAEIYGITSGRLAEDATPFFTVVHPDDLRGLRESIAESACHLSTWRQEWRVSHPLRGELWIEGHSVPLREPDGSTLWHGIATDITERKRAEQELVEQHEQLRALASRVQSVRDEERRMIARDVHDDLGQALTALKIDLTWTQKKLKGRPKMIAERLRAMETVVDGTLESVQKISSELRVGILDDLGLTAAIEWQTEELAARTDIRFIVEHLEEIGELDQLKSTALLRIVQEALTNVVRHAEASEVRISLTRHEGRVLLRITDNGKGITPAEINSRRSIGLVGMKERALAIDGECSVIGTPGKGTTVTVQL